MSQPTDALAERLDKLAHIAERGDLTANGQRGLLTLCRDYQTALEQMNLEVALLLENIRQNDHRILAAQKEIERITALFTPPVPEGLGVINRKGAE